MTFLGAFVAAFAVAAFIMLLNAWVEHNRSKSSLSAPFRWQLGQFNRPDKKYTTNQRKTVKHWKSAIMAVALLGALIVAFTSGCKTAPTPEQQAVTMSNIVRAAEITKVVVRTGVMVDALAAPQHVPLIQKSVDALNTAITLGSLTGGQLAAIVATLPIDKQVVQIVSGSLLIYDSLAILFMTPESSAGTLIIARAIAQGATEGLQFASAQAAAIPKPEVKAAKAPAFIPAPTAENTRKF